MNNDRPLRFQGSYECQQEVLLCEQLAEQGERLLNICWDLERAGVEVRTGLKAYSPFVRGSFK